MDKCAMTGCGRQPTHRVVISAPDDVAMVNGVMNKGSLANIAAIPACNEHVEHLEKVFYGAAYALDGTVTSEPLATATTG